MNEADALDIVQAAIWTVVVASGPAVLAAMVVGVVIAFIQALTQVQEMTLTFVPKILAVLVTVALSAPFIGSQISIFTESSSPASNAVSDAPLARSKRTSRINVACACVLAIDATFAQASRVRAVASMGSGMNAACLS